MRFAMIKEGIGREGEVRAKEGIWRRAEEGVRRGAPMADIEFLGDFELACSG